MTKIYSQGNYIVIEANNERKTFQKKGVGFEIVNDDGLYNLNYKGLPIGDFKYSEVKKEDGSDYATSLEFETFLFENTGNFNSGADVSPNYIPLTGTEEGKPFGGLYKIDINNLPKFSSEFINSNVEYGLDFSDSAMLYLFDFQNNIYNSINPTISGIQVNTSPGTLGLYNGADHSEVQPENKFIYAQRSYVERPETLINCLNNATPEQLSTIKSILGIV